MVTSASGSTISLLFLKQFYSNICILILLSLCRLLKVRRYILSILGNKVSDEALKEAIRHFEDFYEEVFLELTKFGEIEDLNVCDNLGDHLVGNVYVKFASEGEAQAAMQAMNGKFYLNRPIVGEFSPVTDFRECRCKQYDDGSCGSKIFVN